MSNEEDFLKMYTEERTSEREKNFGNFNKETTNSAATSSVRNPERFAEKPKAKPGRPRSVLETDGKPPRRLNTALYNGNYEYLAMLGFKLGGNPSNAMSRAINEVITYYRNTHDDI